MKKLFVCMILKNTKLIKGSMCKITKTNKHCCRKVNNDDGKSQHNKMLFEYITINDWQVVSQLSLVFADVCLSVSNKTFNLDQSGLQNFLKASDWSANQDTN